MYPWLESYPVTTTHPADPQHQILHYPLTKSAVLSSQASIQLAFSRPTIFIPSSRSSPHSSGSSPEFSTEATNQHTAPIPIPPAMSSQPPSFSNRVLPQGRPLPQVPPLPLPLVPIQPPANNPLSGTSIPNPSPITSPSSPTTLHRPKRALPIIPPSPRTPQMPVHPHLSDSPAAPSIGPSDVSPPSQSSYPVEPFSKPHFSPHFDYSPATVVLQRLPPLKQPPRTRIATRRVNAEASSSRVQLPARSPVPLDDLIPPLPPPRPKLKVETPPLTRPPTDHSHRESNPNDHPRPPTQTPPTDPESAPSNRIRHKLPQKALPIVPLRAEPTPGAPDLPRRSSLDSLTTRSSALLSPGQSLSPNRPKRPKSRRISRSPQLYGSVNAVPGIGSVGASDLGITETRNAGRNDHGPAHGSDLEAISPMKFVRDNSDEENEDEDREYRWNETNPGRGGHPVVEASLAQYQDVIILANPAILNSTADEVIDKRLDRIRRRHGETVIREFDVDPRIPLEGHKGKGRAHGVGRFVLSEGEEGETDEEEAFYRPSRGPVRWVPGDYQNYISDRGYGYGHEQAQDVSGQPEVYGNPHFVGNAYEYRQPAGNIANIIEDDESDPDTSGDADNKTPAAKFPPRSTARAFEIEDEMVFTKPKAAPDEEDDQYDEEDDYLYRPRRVVTNARSVNSHEPLSSGSDLGLGGYSTVSRGGSSMGTPPLSSRDNPTSKKFMKHMLRLSGSTHNQHSEKSGGVQSASSSSSSFITPPPSSFQDLGLPQVQNIGPPISGKKTKGRKLIKEKGGQRWEERDYEEIIGSLRKLA